MTGVDSQGLLQIAMNVKDINRAVAFYRDILGLPFLFQAGNLAFFDLGGVRLMLDIPENPRFDHPPVRRCISVSRTSTQATPTSSPTACRWSPKARTSSIRTPRWNCG